MSAWLYRWLPMLFGCHCRDDRSFHWKGKRFPLCARCTGELIGLIAAAVSFTLWHPGLWVCTVLLLPMIADGVLQAATAYESGNTRRLITGLLFGYAILCVMMLVAMNPKQFGLALGQRWGAE